MKPTWWEDLSKEPDEETNFLIDPYIIVGGVSFFWGKTSTAKCESPETEVLMHDLSVRSVGSLCIGDRLMGPDGAPRTVIQTHSGTDEMFRIVPKRGEPWICNSKHILTLTRAWKMIHHRVRSEGREWGEYIALNEQHDIDLDVYLRKGGDRRRQYKLFRAGIQLASNAILPIPPYILGLLLGDGTMRGALALTSVDTPIRDEFVRYLASMGVATREKGVSLYARSHLSISPALKTLGLWNADAGTKFIPATYLHASEEHRLQLLAGLIDTDGSNGGSSLEITSKSRRLALDITFLARSLGMWSSGPRLTYSVCQTGGGGTYYRVHIPYSRALPLRLARKIPTVPTTNSSRTSFDVEPLGRGEYVGFALAEEPHFLLKDLTVMHNSPVSWAMAAAVGRGDHFFGLPAKKGRVLYWEMDMPRGVVKGRLKKIPSAPGVAFRFSPPLSIPNVPPGIVQQAKDDFAEVRPDLVVIDTSRKAHILDERDSRAPREVYAWFQNHFPGAALLVVHHSRKDPLDPRAKRVDDEDYAGSAHWVADAQTGIKITKYRGPRETHRLHYYKSQGAPVDRMRPLPLRLAKDGSTLSSPLYDELLRGYTLFHEEDLRGSALDRALAEEFGVSPSTARRRRMEIESGRFPGSRAFLEVEEDEEE